MKKIITLVFPTVVLFVKTNHKMLKFVLVLTVTFLSFLNGFAQQNLVPNPSFEEYNSCPDAESEFDRVNEWKVFKNNPDYQNSCDLTNNAGVPKNMWGYQQAFYGNAYAGILS